MATVQSVERIQEHKQEILEAFANKDNDGIASSSRNASFKFNANAPEFIPRSSKSPSVSSSDYFVPCFQYLGGNQDTISSLVTNSSSQPKIVLTEPLQNKILKQMEYQFSDLNLLVNDNLEKLINKDTGGFVSISSIASTKKIKSLVGTNHQLIAQALRASLKLDVSSDGKMVKRKVPFTKRVKEELKLRTVVAENLPDDHSHQNIEKIFNVAGCVKTIRICHPQDPSTRSKGDFIISTKLHALVEFENPDAAERAVEKLNDQGSWRKGLRVRCLLRHSPKSVLKKKHFDGILEEKEGHVAEMQTKTPTLTNNPEPLAAVAAVAQSATQIALADTNNAVSSDRKRVKCKVSFTGMEKEDLQLCTVVAENLPDDYSHQNIEKIFSVVGCVKTIQICHPHDPSTRSKRDFIISTKLHALVEFENPDAAERAVEKLNDQRSWRTGLQVRCLLRRSPKSIMKKKDFDGSLEEKGHATKMQTKTSTLTNNPKSAAIAGNATTTVLVDTNNGKESSAGSKKVWSNGRGKFRARTQTSAGRGMLTLTPKLNNSILGEASAKQTVKVPKMPDGTKGFTMGRGRPLSSPPPT